MSKERKRDLVREYRVRRGVYAVRCAAIGEVWASASLNLDAQQNRAWFQMRLGSHPSKSLQAAWKAHGDDAFSFEIVAKLSDEERTPSALNADLRALEAEWREKLGARAATG